MGHRRAWSILGNSQRLDGGAMFGNAPRALWRKWVEPDELNRIPLACRALLIEDGNRKILFETGIGAFFPPQLRDRFGVQEERHVLLDNLQKAGFSDVDIDCVVLSHLHFDHAGGLLSAYEPDEPMRLLFPNANFVVSWEAFQRAKHPHARDRKSFIPELPPLLEETGRLEVVKGHRSDALGADYKLWLSDGHTPGLMLTEIPGKDGPVVFAADLIPGRAWVHLPITMGALNRRKDRPAHPAPRRPRPLVLHARPRSRARPSRPGRQRAVFRGRNMGRALGHHPLRSVVE
jgi:glyoxylase-like metal-dependent hydrolase (beta-lactamase superfamily II)